MERLEVETAIPKFKKDDAPYFGVSKSLLALALKFCVVVGVQYLPEDVADSCRVPLTAIIVAYDIVWEQCGSQIDHEEGPLLWSCCFTCLLVS